MSNRNQDDLSGRDFNSLDAQHGHVCHAPYIKDFLQGTPGSLWDEKRPCRPHDGVIVEDPGECHMNLFPFVISITVSYRRLTCKLCRGELSTV